MTHRNRTLAWKLVGLVALCSSVACSPPSAEAPTLGAHESDGLSSEVSVRITGGDIRGVVSTVDPEIVGMNGNEGSLMTRALPMAGAEGFAEHVRLVYPGQADEMLAHYNVTSADEAQSGIDHLVHDMYFAGPVRAHARSQVALSSPVWGAPGTGRHPHAWGGAARRRSGHLGPPPGGATRNELRQGSRSHHQRGGGTMDWVAERSFVTFGSLG